MSAIKNIYQFVALKGITIAELSKRVSVSNGYFAKQKACNGAVSSKVLQKILSEYPDVNANWLITGDGEKFNNQFNIQNNIRDMEASNAITQKTSQSSSMYVGKKIKQLRNELNLNQTEISSALGISQAYYSDIERGEKKITKSLMNKVIDKWGLSVDYFKDSYMPGVYKDSGTTKSDLTQIKSDIAELFRMFQSLTRPGDIQYPNPTLHKVAYYAAPIAKAASADAFPQAAYTERKMSYSTEQIHQQYRMVQQLARVVVLNDERKLSKTDYIKIIDSLHFQTETLLSILPDHERRRNRVR